MEKANAMVTGPQVMFSELADAWSRVVEMFRSDVVVRRFAWMILGVNLALIAVPVALELAEIAGLIADTPRDFINPARDRSLPEFFNYLQAGLTAAFLFLAWRRSRAVALLAWAAIFAFILLDDSLEYHEVVGAWLARTFALSGVEGLRAVDSGELLAWAIAGAVLLPLVAVAALRSDGVERGFALLIGLAFAALAFSGIVMDMVHVLLGSRVVTILEDGGEMLSIAAACVLSFAWYRGTRAK